MKLNRGRVQSLLRTFLVCASLEATAFLLFLLLTGNPVAAIVNAILFFGAPLSVWLGPMLYRRFESLRQHEQQT